MKKRINLAVVFSFFIFLFLNNLYGEEIKEERYFFENISKIEIDAESLNLTIIPTEDDIITAKYNYYPSNLEDYEMIFFQEDDTLIINQFNNLEESVNYNDEVTLYIPSNLIIQQLSVNSNVLTLKINGTSIDNLNINSDKINFDLYDSNIVNTNVISEYFIGEMYNNISSKFNIKTSTLLGKMGGNNINDLQIESQSGNLSLDKNIINNMKVEKSPKLKIELILNEDSNYQIITKTDLQDELLEKKDGYYEYIYSDTGQVNVLDLGDANISSLEFEINKENSEDNDEEK